MLMLMLSATALEPAPPGTTAIGEGFCRGRGYAPSTVHAAAVGSIHECLDLCRSSCDDAIDANNTTKDEARSRTASNASCGGFAYDDNLTPYLKDETVRNCYVYCDMKVEYIYVSPSVGWSPYFSCYSVTVPWSPTAPPLGQTPSPPSMHNISATVPATTATSACPSGACDLYSPTLFVMITAAVCAAAALAYAALRCRRRRKETLPLLVQHLDTLQVPGLLSTGTELSDAGQENQLEPERPPAPVRRLQISFASEDAMHALKYYDMVQQHTDGWSVCELMPPGVSDSAWFERWNSGLESASACLIIFTAQYKESANRASKTALRMEAAQIQKRMRRDKSFRVLVLDPMQVGQDYANLKLYLDHGELRINEGDWRTFIKAKRVASPGQPAGASSTREPIVHRRPSTALARALGRS